MTKLEVFDFYMPAIHHLVEEFEFGNFLFEDRTRDGFRKWRADKGGADGYKYLASVGLDIDYGMTKVVLIGECNYVLKIPFEGLRFDYCKLEVSNYRKAQEFGVEGYFAACDFLTELEDEESDNCVPIYIMEKVKVNEAALTQTIIKDYPAISSDYEIARYPEDGIREEAALDFLAEEYGDNYNTFYDFICDQGINDIHGANIGLAARGWVVCDYSSYVG